VKEVFFPQKHHQGDVTGTVTTAILALFPATPEMLSFSERLLGARLAAAAECGRRLAV
jgi:hypothetical protein